MITNNYRYSFALFFFLSRCQDIIQFFYYYLSLLFDIYDNKYNSCIGIETFELVSEPSLLFKILLFDFIVVMFLFLYTVILFEMVKNWEKNEEKVRRSKKFYLNEYICVIIVHFPLLAAVSFKLLLLQLPGTIKLPVLLFFYFSYSYSY